jgi:hypothetical protein
MKQEKQAASSSSCSSSTWWVWKKAVVHRSKMAQARKRAKKENLVQKRR